MRLRRYLSLVAFTLFGAPIVVIAAGTKPSSFVLYESGHVRPLALSEDGSTLVAVNTPDSRLEVFEVTGTGLVARASVPVGIEPVAVALRANGEAWVVNQLSDSISVVDTRADSPHVIRTLLVGDEPSDVVFAGANSERAFITTAHRGQNHKLDPELYTPGIGRADVWVFDVNDLGVSLGGDPLVILSLFGDSPRALAVSPDGTTVYAAIFRSGNQTTTVSEVDVCNGGENAPPCKVKGFDMPGGMPGPDLSSDGVERPEVGLIVKYNPLAEVWEDSLGRNWNNSIRVNLPDKDVFAIDAMVNPPAEKAFFPHVGTVLFNMAVNPVSGRVYVSNTEARNDLRLLPNVRGQIHKSRITILDGAVVTARYLNKHIDYQQVPSPAGVLENSLSTPMGMAVSSDGQRLYLAAMGSNVVAVFQTAELEADTFEPNAADHIAVTGGGPTGLVLDEERKRLYVMTRFDQGISIVDIESRAEIAHVRMFSPEPPEIVRGRRFLYDATATSSNGEASCAACHVFGDEDSLAWDLSEPDLPVFANPLPFRSIHEGSEIEVEPFHPMKGPMMTQTLRGIVDSGPMHWRGDRNGGSAGVDPRDAEASFGEFAGAFVSLLGREAPLNADDFKALSDFSLRMTLPPNAIRRLDNSLTEEEQIASDFFFTSRNGGKPCVFCHSLDPELGFFGTDGIAVEPTNNATFQMKVPHLRDLYRRVGLFALQPGFEEVGETGFIGDQVRGYGYFHDGSSGRLVEDPMSGDPHGGGAVAFLMVFPTNLAPVVNQQVTLTPTNAEVAGPRIDLLRERAGVGECDLVTTGLIGIERRSWLLGPDGLFRGDRMDEAPLSDAALRMLAQTVDATLTYTCTPPGTGLRTALDRDLDGHFDRDEEHAGTNPADAGSFPDTTPLPTETTPPTPTQTPTPGFCQGDCDRNQIVSIDELVRSVDIALGGSGIESCTASDRDGSGQIEIGELVAAVNSALAGCVP